MGGFFGTVSKASCVTDLFYGTDYNSHLGTKRGGLATYDAEEGMFARSIHNLESTYFRTKFEDELDKFKGNVGIGIISDTDPQPIIINSHLGRFAIVTVAKIVNLEEIEAELLSQNMHFAELSSGNTNQTELISLLIIQGKTFVEGIENVYRRVKGSCSMLLLSEDGSIIAARDKWGRTPIVIGRKEGAYAATSESSSFPNLDYEIDRYLGPGEIVRMTADGVEQLRKPEEKMQICSFLWVYYGFPTSCYEGRNVEEVRFTSGLKMGQIIIHAPFYKMLVFGVTQKQLLPSKQCVQTLHFGNPMDSMRVSRVLNFKVVRPKRSAIMLTIFSYSGEPVVAYFSRFLSASPSSSAIIRRVINSNGLLEAVKPTNGQA
jgi:amidophosphoribosyltransferase